MENENENQNEKGNAKLVPPHLLCIDKSMEMITSKVEVSPDNSTSKVQVVSVSSNGKTPCSDNHILCDILSRLPVKSLMRFKSVCTHWKSLIESDSYLSDLHAASSKSRFGGQKLLLFMSLLKPEPDQGEGIIEFSTASPYREPEFKKLVLDRKDFGIPKQTVNGLVCITAGREAFIIYNPSTGERSPWLSTTTASQGKPGKGRRNVDCIAFGYSPATNEHKVLCISSIKRECDSKNVFSRLADNKDEIGAEDQVCEVMTIGENTWRRLDEIPPYSLESKDVYVGGGSPCNWEGNSVYVNGSIYWRFQYTQKGEVVMGFDVEKEKFRIIPIPDFIIDPQKYKFSQSVELMELDGHIAVLVGSSLWVMDEDGDSIQWIKEEILIPDDWDGKPDLAIVALPGTNLIIQKSQYSVIIYYCERKTKKYHESEIAEEYWGQLKQITYLDENLAPVHTRRRCMF